MAEKNKQAGIRIARRYKGLCVNCGRPLSMLDKKVTGQIKCKTCREKNKKDTKQRKHQK